VNKETQGSSAWLERLDKTELPVLATVVRELNAMTADSDSSVNQLTKVILKDGNLTSKVLKIANSVIYNPSGKNITTISRAVVLLGFEAVRSICVSAMLMDSLLSKGHKQNLLECLGDSFHAAVQAKNLCAGMDDIAKEEIFVATLLSNVGEMVFWSCGGKQADALSKIKAESGFEEPGYERAILGTTFDDLSLTLSKDWSLGSLLQQVLEPNQHPSQRTSIIKFGMSLSKVAKQGFKTGEFTRLLSEVSIFTGQRPDDLMQSIRAQAQEARSMAASYGIPRAANLIPSDDQQTAEQDPNPETSLRQKMHVLSNMMKEAASADQQGQSPREARKDDQGDLKQKMGNLSDLIMDALYAGESYSDTDKDASTQDKNLQLEILSELSNMIVERVSVNSIFQLVLEGMHRGISLRRVLIAPLNSKTQQLKAKYVLGKDTESWLSVARFSTLKAGVFHQLSRSPKALWLGEDPEEEPDKQLQPLLEKGQCFIAALTIGPRMVGAVYADQGGQDLTEEQFASFRHFVQQTNFGLLSLAKS
jgi:HD-like signal output (HDOD) protein|tara:strand:+ start:1946 stop:3547 length:1602 start_codon:yes stop_codon:yes gene_type:complete